MKPGAAWCCIALAAMVIATSAEALAEPACYAKEWDDCVDWVDRLVEDDRARAEREHPTVGKGLRKRWKAKCVDEEDAASCALLAIARTEGYGGPVDEPSAIAATWLICEFDRDACELVIDALRAGAGLPQDDETANAIAVTMLGEAEVEADAEDFERRDAIALCDSGRADFCVKAAVMLEQGKGGVPDRKLAMDLFWVACDLDRSLCIDIAYAYAEGKKVKRNKEQAERFRKLALAREGRKGCRYGKTERCVTHGYAYLEGTHVARDREYAVVLFREACDAGDADACTGLADALWSGPKKKRDQKKAALLYEKACRAESASACWKLGRLYLRGEDVEQEPARAEKLFKRACELGDQAGCEYVENKP